ncbi:MAG: amidohydrolase family protein, partial [Thermoanaerobaculia bacterium]
DNIDPIAHQERVRSLTLVSSGLSGYEFTSPEYRASEAQLVEAWLSAGGSVVIASDGPLLWHDPLKTLEVSVTRQNPGGSDSSVAANEAVDLPTAIKATTLDFAGLMNHDDTVGSIEEEYGVELDLSGDEGYRGNFTSR